MTDFWYSTLEGVLHTVRLVSCCTLGSVAGCWLGFAVAKWGLLRKGAYFYQCDQKAQTAILRLSQRLENKPGQTLGSSLAVYDFLSEHVLKHDAEVVLRYSDGREVSVDIFPTCTTAKEKP